MKFSIYLNRRVFVMVSKETYCMTEVYHSTFNILMLSITKQWTFASSLDPDQRNCFPCHIIGLCIICTICFPGGNKGTKGSILQ